MEHTKRLRDASMRLDNVIGNAADGSVTDDAALRAVYGISEDIDEAISQLEDTISEKEALIAKLKTSLEPNKGQ